MQPMWGGVVQTTKAQTHCGGLLQRFNIYVGPGDYSRAWPVTRLSVDNHAKAEEACNGMAMSFHKLNKHLPCLANYTNDSIHVFSVSDGTQCRLVRCKLLTILKPTVRCSNTQKALGSLKGTSGSHNYIIRHLEEHKRECKLLHYETKGFQQGKG